MNAKKCDRCGRYYEVGSQFKYDVATIDQNGDVYELWDLCNDCLTEFFNWVNMKKEDE